MKDGGAAFPGPEWSGQTGDGVPGMSLRDWFAGQALAMLANSDVWTNYPDLATRCYAAADAMLAAREKSDG